MRAILNRVIELAEQRNDEERQLERTFGLDSSGGGDTPTAFVEAPRPGYLALRQYLDSLETAQLGYIVAVRNGVLAEATNLDSLMERYGHSIRETQLNALLSHIGSLGKLIREGIRRFEIR